MAVVRVLFLFVAASNRAARRGPSPFSDCFKIAFRALGDDVAERNVIRMCGRIQGLFRNDQSGIGFEHAIQDFQAFQDRDSSDSAPLRHH